MASEMEKLGGAPGSAQAKEQEWLDMKPTDLTTRHDREELVVAHITDAIGDARKFYGKEHREMVTPRVVTAFKLPQSWLNAS